MTAKRPMEGLDATEVPHARRRNNPLPSRQSIEVVRGRAKPDVAERGSARSGRISPTVGGRGAGNGSASSDDKYNIVL